MTMKKTQLLLAVTTFLLLLMHSCMSDSSCEETGLLLANNKNCIDINNKWNNFQRILRFAQDDDIVIFCPFRITSNTNLPAKPSRRSKFVCQKEGECIIRNTNAITIVINHRRAETTFWGFVFEGSSSSRIMMMIHIRNRSSENKQRFCNCRFQNSISTNSARGGVIRADRNTIVDVISCAFVNNTISFGRGGAIYGRGKYLNVTSSYFSHNRATQGGAIAFAKYSTLILRDNTFEENFASSVGSNVYVNIVENLLSQQYIDDGGNSVVVAAKKNNAPNEIRSKNSCNGLYNRRTRKCHEFEPSIPSLPWTAFPTFQPTELPTQQVPSANPSFLPSTLPSFHPTISIHPSNIPSLSPTKSISPSRLPTTTIHPTSMYMPPPDPFEEKLPLVDRNQPKGYYNFNIHDLDYGPNAWSKIDVSNNEFSRYVREGLNVTVNECDSHAEQTPIDLNINTDRDTCKEFHQIRARGGDWKNLTKENEISFHILPSHLRIQIDSSNPRAPRADSPGGFVQLYADHVEITMPSLHTIHGKRYDAEYTIYHVQGKLNRILVLSVVVDASQNVYNSQFQRILNAFWNVKECGLQENSSSPKIDKRFNLYHIKLIPSIYWFAYDGSLPRPPCSKIANWRVYDTPMQISYLQLKQIQYLLTRYSACSFDGYGNVRTRPLMPIGTKRRVWKCTKNDFLSDCERFGKLCPAP